MAVARQATTLREWLCRSQMQPAAHSDQRPAKCGGSIMVPAIAASTRRQESEPDKMKPTNHSTKSNRHVSRRRFVSNLAAAVAGTAALATPSGAKRGSCRPTVAGRLGGRLGRRWRDGRHGRCHSGRTGGSRTIRPCVQTSRMAMGQAAGAAAALATSAGSRHPKCRSRNCARC